MPQLILKAHRDTDLYCIWSTVVDGATYIFNRDELIEHMRFAMRGPLQSDEDFEREIDKMMTRIDTFGTSHGNSTDADGGFDDKYLFVRDGGAEKGLLPRHRLGDYLYTKGNDLNLFEPIDD